MSLLKVDDIHTYYGKSYILQGVSLEVERGRLVALLGRNGVGKSTLIRSICGLTPPRQGIILVKGQNVVGQSPYRISGMGIRLIPQGRRIFPSLTVGENLRVALRPQGSTGWTIERVLGTFPRLAERIQNRAGKLSGGEQQMLATARALVGNPEILLMDEPSEGLAPLVMADLGRVIAQLKQDGLSVLLVEQNLTFALELAEHVYVMSKGHIVYDASPAEVSNNTEVKARYLGV
jgi:branched-chain amino acid transport system ATP-binding protein